MHRPVRSCWLNAQWTLDKGGPLHLRNAASQIWVTKKVRWVNTKLHGKLQLRRVISVLNSSIGVYTGYNDTMHW